MKPREIADEIIQSIRQSGNDAVTYPWQDFYEICERERIHDSFMKKIINQLREQSFIMAQGSSVVLIAKDFNWAPRNE